jgi:hypothetical protein
MMGRLKSDQGQLFYEFHLSVGGSWLGFASQAAGRHRARRVNRWAEGDRIEGPRGDTPSTLPRTP